MTDSPQRSSFRKNWLPTGTNSDVTLSLQSYMDVVIMAPDVLYYFKPLATFEVPGLSDDAKFEDIDSYIAEEFGCGPDDIHTIKSNHFGFLIVMPEPALRRACVTLPPWSDENRAATVVPMDSEADRQDRRA